MYASASSHAAPLRPRCSSRRTPRYSPSPSRGPFKHNQANHTNNSTLVHTLPLSLSLSFVHHFIGLVDDDDHDNNTKSTQATRGGSAIELDRSLHLNVLIARELMLGIILSRLASCTHTIPSYQDRSPSLVPIQSIVRVLLLWWRVQKVSVLSVVFLKRWLMLAHKLCSCVFYHINTRFSRSGTRGIPCARTYLVVQCR